MKDVCIFIYSMIFNEREETSAILENFKVDVVVFSLQRNTSDTHQGFLGKNIYVTLVT